MHAARFGVDMILQRIGIGGFELAQLTPIQHALGQVMYGGQIFQNIRSSGVSPRFTFLAPLIAQLVKHNLAQLLWTAHIKAFPRHIVNFSLKTRHFLCKVVGHARQRIAIHFDPGHLHLGQNWYQRPLKPLINASHFLKMQFGLQKLPKAQRDISVLSSIGCGLFNRHKIKGNR